MSISNTEGSKEEDEKRMRVETERSKGNQENDVSITAESNIFDNQFVRAVNKTIQRALKFVEDYKN